MHQILIAEDEPRIASFVEKGLRSHGFITTVATDANQALLMVRSGEFDLMILDLGLPGKDGLEVLEELRRQGERFPIIILTARDGVESTVAGLEGGADDYVTKPFSFEELLARVRVRLRSVAFMQQSAEEMMLKARGVVLNLHTRKVNVGDREIELATREFMLAEIFLRHPGQVLSREQLLDQVWGHAYELGSNVVDVYVGYLRKKLGSHLIETVRGIGYRLRE